MLVRCARSGNTSPVASASWVFLPDDTALRDIHGAPFLLGLAAGSAFELHRRAAAGQSLPALAATEWRQGRRLGSGLADRGDPGRRGGQ